MSDGELARYKELFSELSDGSRSLEGVPTCVNRKDMDNTTVGVYPLDPKDFDGETFYVILPYEQKMDDGQILEEAPPQEFFSNPKNERTKLFLSKVLI